MEMHTKVLAAVPGTQLIVSTFSLIITVFHTPVAVSIGYSSFPSKEGGSCGPQGYPVPTVPQNPRRQDAALLSPEMQRDSSTPPLLCSPQPWPHGAPSPWLQRAPWVPGAEGRSGQAQRRCAAAEPGGGAEACSAHWTR